MHIYWRKYVQEKISTTNKERQINAQNTLYTAQTPDKVRRW